MTALRVRLRSNTIVKRERNDDLDVDYGWTEE